MIPMSMAMIWRLLLNVAGHITKGAMRIAMSMVFLTGSSISWKNPILLRW